MAPHYWIEARSKRRIAVFVAVVVAITVFWTLLPEELRSTAFHRRMRGVVQLSVIMFVGWVGGWFLLLFVRGEDLHKSAPFDFQVLGRVIAVAMIVVSLIIAGFFSLAFVA